MATYNGLSAFKKAVKSGALGGSSGGSGTGQGQVMTEAQARAKVAKWQNTVEKTLRNYLQQYGYKPGGNVMYGRTGEYPKHTAKSGVTVANSIASGTVYYTPYWRDAEYTNAGIEIMELLEHGYHVRTPIWYIGRDGNFHFDFRNIRYFGTRPPAEVKSKVVAALAGAAAADGVTIRLA